MKKEYLIYKLSEEMKEATRIDTALFPKFDVKRGLRNEDGDEYLFHHRQTRNHRYIHA